MTDFIKKHKVLIIAAVIILAAIITLFAQRRSIGNFALDNIYFIKCAQKPMGTVNKSDGSQIIFKGVSYQILDKTIEEKTVGGWIGGFRKLAVLDANRHVIAESNLSVDYNSQIRNTLKAMPSGANAVAAYFNVYSIKGMKIKNAVAVNLLGGTYEAVPAGKLAAGEKPYRFEKEEKSKVGSFLNESGT